MNDVPFVDLGRTGSPDILGGFLVCFLTLAVFSFLYKDNPFYKIAEHLFVGVSTAWYTMEFYDSGIVGPLMDYLPHAWRAGETGEMLRLGGYPIAPGFAIGLRLLAIGLGLMLLSRLFVRNAWPSRWPLAIMVGVFAALKLTGETQSKLVLQIKSTMRPLINPDAVPWSEASQIEQTQIFAVVAHLIFVVGLTCVLAHFIFTYRRTALLKGASRFGIIMLMLTFGSMFGFTVLGRIALLIERISDLRSYATPDYALGILGIATSPPILIGAIIILVLVLARLQKRAA